MKGTYQCRVRPGSTPEVVSYGPHGFNLKAALDQNFADLPDSEAAAFNRILVQSVFNFVLRVRIYTSRVILVAAYRVVAYCIWFPSSLTVTSSENS